MDNCVGGQRRVCGMKRFFFSSKWWKFILWSPAFKVKAMTLSVSEQILYESSLHLFSCASCKHLIIRSYSNNSVKFKACRCYVHKWQSKWGNKVGFQWLWTRWTRRSEYLTSWSDLQGLHRLTKDNGQKWSKRLKIAIATMSLLWNNNYIQRLITGNYPFLHLLNKNSAIED